MQRADEAAKLGILAAEAGIRAEALPAQLEIEKKTWGEKWDVVADLDYLETSHKEDLETMHELEAGILRGSFRDDSQFSFQLKSLQQKRAWRSSCDSTTQRHRNTSRGCKSPSR
jgi:hypothetical protein